MLLILKRNPLCSEVFVIHSPSFDSYIFLCRADYIITLYRGCALPFKEVLYGYYPTLLPLGCTLLALHLCRWLSIVVAPFLSDLAQRLSST
ncbi:hypothetical protein VPH5P1C_0075 [Vibrio phage 5P1c]